MRFRPCSGKIGVMITKITDISGMHGLDSFMWSGQELRKFSLLYGWNGSGKSTLANILYFLEHRAINLSDYEGLTFKIHTNSATIKATDLVGSEYLIRVFNRDFIDKNLFIEQAGATPIIMLDEQKVGLLEKITELEQKQQEETTALAELNAAHRKIPDADDILTKAAGEWRKRANDLGVTGYTYYGSTFQRGDVRKLMSSNELSSEKLDTHIVPPKDEVMHTDAVKTKWQALSVPVQPETNFGDLFQIANALLKKTVKLQKTDIDALTKEVKDWVELGIGLHDGKDKCFFCDNNIRTDRLATLRKAFTDELKTAEQELDDLLGTIGDAISSLSYELPDSSLVHVELQEEYITGKAAIDNAVAPILKSLGELKNDVTVKRDFISDDSKTFPGHENPTDNVNSHDAAITSLITLLEKHNEKVGSQATENEKHLKQLLLHTLSSYLKNNDYFDVCEKRAKSDKAMQEKRTELEDTKSQIASLKADINNHKIAVDKINGLLSNFFDKNKISFVPFEEDGVTKYRIMRRGKPATSLSEGERSVIALAYFLVSINENGARIQDMTVVIDDPVDSQDSNFLFRAYGVMRRCLDKAQQTIILTHNHEFFNLIRDWFCINQDGTQYSLLLTERNIANAQENMEVTNLPKLLSEYKTEYTYLFVRLYNFVHGEELDSPLAANVTRKVLEYFSSFKWSCRNSMEFADRIQGRFVNSSEQSERAIGDAVNKFVNEYSHALDPFRSIDITAQEAKGVAENALKFIRVADEEHYDAL